MLACGAKVCSCVFGFSKEEEEDLSIPLFVQRRKRRRGFCVQEEEEEE